MFAAMVLAGFALQGDPVVVWFSGTGAEVSDKLALKCADLGATVVEQDDRHVLCQRESNSVAAQYLFGGRGSTSPMLTVRFAILKDGKDLRVQAVQWIEVGSALGQTRRTFLDSNKHQISLRGHLHNAGAHDYPPSQEEAATAAPAPAR